MALLTFTCCSSSSKLSLIIIAFTNIVATGFLGSSAGKESSCNAGHPGLIPGLRKSAGEGIGYPLQYSGLENSTDWVVLGVAKSWT